MMTEKQIRSLTQEQMVAAIILLTGNDIKVRGIKAQQKQIEDIVKHLEDNSLVSKIADKEDKTWDRLKSFVDELDVYIEKIDGLQSKLIGLEKSKEIVEKASSRSIISFLNEDARN